VSTWPFWVWIGVIIFSTIARIAMIGKETTTKHTAGAAIISLVVNTAMVWWLIVVMQHLC
jgi:hypothetical protein